MISAALSPCPRCLSDAPGEEELSEYLDRYAASLPEETRAGERTYAARLRACAVCSLRAGQMCSVCGCYIKARAAKRALSCPKPGGAEWGREGE